MLVGSVDSLLPSPAPAREGSVVPAAPKPAAPERDDPPAGKAAPSEEELLRAFKQANAALRRFTQLVEFEYDADAHRTVIRLIDSQTREVLRQVPSAEMLQIARALDQMQLMLLHDEA